MLGKIFGNLFDFILEKIISRWVELQGVNARGQIGFRVGRSTLDDILTLCTLIKEEIFVGQCLYSCFVGSKKTFDTILHDKLLERLKQLGVAPHLK